MGIRLNRTTKIIIWAVVAILAAQAILFSVGTFDKPEQQAYARAASSSDDQSIAADLSNLTGVASERILEMKAAGQSWNGILEQLKDEGVDTEIDDREARGRQLLETTLGEDAVRRLAADGYAESDIWNAEMLAERVASQLKELTESAESLAPVAPLPTAASEGEDDEDEFQSELRAVSERFDLEAAVTLMLVLQSDFGSFEAVLDEYLLSLQLGIDLNDYAEAKDEYEEQKASKRAELASGLTITLSELDRRVLERITKQNDAMKDKVVAAPQVSFAGALASEEDSPLPDVPNPAVEDVKPRNPAAAIEAELDRLNPNVE